jgi:hypothetical protein
MFATMVCLENIFKLMTSYGIIFVKKKIGTMQGIRGFGALEFWLMSWKPPYGFFFFFSCNVLSSLSLLHGAQLKCFVYIEFD